jgi:hypothetical protein
MDKKALVAAAAEEAAADARLEEEEVGVGDVGEDVEVEVGSMES